MSLARFMIRNRPHYGWWIVGASLATGCIILGIRVSFGVYFKSLEAEFMLNRAATSAIYSVFMVFSAGFTPVAGWALDRWGPRLTVAAMAVISCASLVLASLTTAAWQLFITYSLLLAVASGGTYIVLTAAVSRWFIPTRRGVALGIASSGVAAGTMTIVPLSAFLIENLGWRLAYLVTGLGAAALVLPISLLFRRNPEDVGLKPYGQSENPSVPVTAAPAETGRSYTLSEVLQMRDFWLNGGIWFFFAAASAFVLTHGVPHMTDAGLAVESAAAVMSLAGAIHIASRLTTGWFMDRIGARKIGALGALLMAVSYGLMIWVQSSLGFYAWAILFGIAWGGFGLASTTIIINSFSGRTLGMIMGIIDIAFAVGSAAGPAFGGLVYDSQASYSAAFLASAAACIILVVLVLSTGRGEQKTYG